MAFAPITATQPKVPDVLEAKEIPHTSEVWQVCTIPLRTRAGFWTPCKSLPIQDAGVGKGSVMTQISFQQPLQGVTRAKAPIPAQGGNCCRPATCPAHGLWVGFCHLTHFPRPRIFARKGSTFHPQGSVLYHYILARGIPEDWSFPPSQVIQFM